MATLRVLTGLGRPRLILSLDLPWLRLTQPQSRVEKGDKPLGADFGLVVVWVLQPGVSQRRHVVWEGDVGGGERECPSG